MKTIMRVSFGGVCASTFVVSMTRRRGITADEDPGMKALVEAQTPVVTLVGKSSEFQATKVLSVTPEENLKMIGDSVRFIRAAGRQVVYDAEHFFDAYKANPQYAVRTLLAAQEAGASVLCLCDTNGGSMPELVAEAVGDGEGADVGAHRHPHPQRRRPGRRQRPGGDPRRGWARPGHHQRRRRALREHGPHPAHRQPPAQVQPRLPRRRFPAAPHRREPVRLRDGQPEPRLRPALCRQQRLRPQGRHARSRRTEGCQHLRARGPRERGQQPQGAHQRDVRPEQHHRQGRPQVRHRKGQGRPQARA